MNEDSSNLIPQELEVIHNNVDQNGAPILINPYILKLTERLTTITIDIINNAVQQSLDAATKSIKDAQEKFVKSIRDACYCGDNQPWKFEAALFTIKNNRSKKNGLSIDCCDRNGINALQFACARGHLQLVKVLMQHGANIDAKTQTPRSWSCLHFACFYRKPDIIHLLIGKFVENAKVKPKQCVYYSDFLISIHFYLLLHFA